MDMELSEQQKKLVDTARRFMEKECPLSAVREMESTETGFSLDLWQKMGALGWLGLPFPEQYGGYGLGHAGLGLPGKGVGRGGPGGPPPGPVGAGPPVPRDTGRRGDLER